MSETYLHIHHTSTPTGEYVSIQCPHCGRKIELVAKLLPDNDMIVLSNGEDEQCDETNHYIKKT
jgi:uncharacterized radical SAM superfamily protein